MDPSSRVGKTEAERLQNAREAEAKERATISAMKNEIDALKREVARLKPAAAATHPATPRP